MNGAQARLMLDGAEAWLCHVRMPIKDLTARFEREDRAHREQRSLTEWLA